MSRAEFEEVLSAIVTFFGVLLTILFVIGVSSNGALKGHDAFLLRWTVITLALAFSGVLAWVRWKTVLRRRLSSVSNERVRVHQASSRIGPPALSPFEASRLQSRGGSAEIEAAARQAIVFRQHFPPQMDGSALSFFGGAPLAPRHFRWPRSDGRGGPSKPFSFLMQIDCAAVPAEARLGMLPDNGVLYFFLDLRFRQPDTFRVVYEERSGKDWVAAEPPADLDVAFGDHAFVWRWTQSVQDCPQLLPKWTFQPVAIRIPRNADPANEHEDDAPWLWPGEKSTADALRVAQGEEVVSRPFSVKDLVDADRTMRRPFANYPHDWRAIQICSGLLLERVGETNRLPSTWALRELPDSDRDALVRRIRDEARAWFQRAASHAPFAAVPRADADQFWSWLTDKPWLVRFVITDALTLSIEASLAESAEAAARVPPDAAGRVQARHALAVRSEDKLFANIPDRMLAPPVDVQGNQWERAKTHLLLLEISTNEGLGHHFGEGVIQFWITPADLQARRFDKVELTTDAY